MLWRWLVMRPSQLAVASSVSRWHNSPARRIGLSATTGAVAKGLSVFAQLVAVAIAVRSLGSDGFALYVVIASLVSWIGLAGLGVAPGLTLGIARAAADSDRAEEARHFVVAVAMMATIAVMLLGVAAVLGASGWLEQALAGTVGSTSADASAAILCLAALMALQLVVVVPEAAQLGLQTQYVSNTWAAVGSAAALVAMIAVGGAVTSVAAFILVSQGPQVAARVANGLIFVLRRRYLLVFRGLRFWQHAGPIVGSGLAFAGFQIASYASLQIGLLILAATSGAASVALAGVIVRALTLQGAALALVTTPTWPAMAGAAARGDLAWIRRAYRLLLAGGLAYSGVVAVAIIVALEAIIAAWTGMRPPDNAPVRLLLGMYVVVNGVAHVNAMTLVGLGALRWTAIVLMSEAAVVVALQVAMIPNGGVTGYVAALAIGSLCVSGWILGVCVLRRLRPRAAT